MAGHVLVGILCLLANNQLAVESTAIKAPLQTNNDLVLRFEKYTDDGSCHCSGTSCSCCQTLKIKQLHFNKQVCLNVKYLQQEIGIQMTVTVDGKVVIQKKISASNPPPVCAKVKLLKEKVDVCIQFYDLKPEKSSLSGCARLTAKMAFVKEIKVELGCFNIKLQGEYDEVGGNLFGWSGRPRTFTHYRITEIIAVWKKRII